MQDVFFGQDITKLHGVLTRSAAPGSPGVVILHPHPQYGGNMNNNVVLGVEKECVEAGYTTLRFNFRGTGRSKGVFDNGVGEQDDVRAAVDLLESDDSVGPIAVIGYSFGAAVGLPVAVQDERVCVLAGIAPPTVMADFSFLADCTKPLLIIAGDSDNFCEHAKISMMLKKDSQRFKLLQGMNHFYLGEELRAGRIICDFLNNTISSQK